MTDYAPVLELARSEGWTAEETRAAVGLAILRRRMREMGDDPDGDEGVTESLVEEVRTDKAGHTYCTQEGKGRVACGGTSAATAPHPHKVRQVIDRVKASRAAGAATTAATWTADKYKRVMDTKGGRAWKRIEHALTVGMRYTQRLALEAARERGISEKHAERVARVMAVADYVGTFGTAGLGGVLGSAFGPAGVIAGKTVGSATPSVSLLYLLYSTARNPAATLRAARKAIRGQMAQLPGHDTHQKQGSESVIDDGPYAALLERFDRYDGDDTYEALIYAALEEHPDSVTEAIELADAAYAEMLSELGAESEDAPPGDPLAPLWSLAEADGRGFTGEKKVTVRGKEQTWYYQDGKRVANPHKADATPKARKAKAAEPAAPKAAPVSVDEAHAKLSAGEMSLADLAGQKWKKADWQALAVKLGGKKSGTVAQLQDRIRDALKPKSPDAPPASDRLAELSSLARSAGGKGLAGLDDAGKAAVKAFVKDHPDLAAIMAEMHAAGAKPAEKPAGDAEPAAAKPAEAKRGRFAEPLSESGTIPADDLTDDEVMQFVKEAGRELSYRPEYESGLIDLTNLHRKLGREIDGLTPDRFKQIILDEVKKNDDFSLRLINEVDELSPEQKSMIIRDGGRALYFFSPNANKYPDPESIGSPNWHAEKLAAPGRGQARKIINEARRAAPKAGGPEPVDDDAVAQEVHDAIQDHMSEFAGAGIGFDRLYPRLKEKFPGLTTDQFHAILKRERGAGRLGLSGWSKTRQEMPDQTLAIDQPGGTGTDLYYAHSLGGGLVHPHSSKAKRGNQ